MSQLTKSHLLGTGIDNFLQNMTTQSKINATNTLIQEVKTDSDQADAELKNELTTSVNTLLESLSKISDRVVFLEEQDLVEHPELEQAMVDFLQQDAVKEILASKQIIVNGSKVAVADAVELLLNAPDPIGEAFTYDEVTGDPKSLTVDYPNMKHVFNVSKEQTGENSYKFLFKTTNYLGYGEDGVFERRYTLTNGWPRLDGFTYVTFVLEFPEPSLYDFEVPDTDGDGIIGFGDALDDRGTIDPTIIKQVVDAEEDVL